MAEDKTLARRVGADEMLVRTPELRLLIDRAIPLEICPASNLRTGALSAQLNRLGASIQEHPLPQLLRHGIPVVLSTDDPSIFHTSLREEYEHAYAMGLSESELAQLIENGFTFSFLAPLDQHKLHLRPA